MPWLQGKLWTQQTDHKQQLHYVNQMNIQYIFWQNTWAFILKLKSLHDGARDKCNRWESTNIWLGMDGSMCWQGIKYRKVELLFIIWFL